MPSHFDRFRLLNEGRRGRNVGDDIIYLRPGDEGPEVPVAPGEEVDIPYSPQGEAVISWPSV